MLPDVHALQLRLGAMMHFTVQQNTSIKKTFWSMGESLHPWHKVL